MSNPFEIILFIKTIQGKLMLFEILIFVIGINCFILLLRYIDKIRSDPLDYPQDYMG
jgi:hypothetical protein